VHESDVSHIDTHAALYAFVHARSLVRTRSVVQPSGRTIVCWRSSRLRITCPAFNRHSATVQQGQYVASERVIKQVA